MQSLRWLRFLREISTTARLDHSHILPVLDSGEAALCYSMPYVRGESLRDRLRRETQLPVEGRPSTSPGRSPLERGRGSL